MLRVQPSQSEGQHACPLCRDDLESEEQQACASCETTYHRACLGELGGCSTLGCQLRGKLPDSLPNWFCRACHQPIESDLRRRNCRCSAYLHDACVEAHGEACERAGELRLQTGRPRKRDHSVPSIEELRRQGLGYEPVSDLDVRLFTLLALFVIVAGVLPLLLDLIEHIGMP